MEMVTGNSLREMCSSLNCVACCACVLVYKCSEQTFKDCIVYLPFVACFFFILGTFVTDCTINAPAMGL